MAIKYEKIVKEDLNLGYGAVTVTNPQGGNLAGNKVGLHTFGKGYNVKESGALGDGTTDDAASIQAVIDRAEADGGGVVHFPVGDYRIGSAVTIDSPNVHLSGMGRWSRIVATAPLLKMLEIATYGCSVKDLVFLGDGTDKQGEDPEYSQIKLTGAYDCEISGCRFEDYNEIGIFLNTSYHNRIHHNFFKGIAASKVLNPYAAIFLESAGGNVVDANQITGGFLQGILLGTDANYTFDGETASSPRYNVISNNYISGGFDHCIYQSSGRDNSYTGNVVRDSAGVGIKVDGSGSLCSGNRVIGCVDGIYFRRPTKCVAVGNHITVTRYGILAAASSTAPGAIEDITIEGNHIETSGVYGIFIRADDVTSSARISIQSNIVRHPAGATTTYGIIFGTAADYLWNEVLIANNVIDRAAAGGTWGISLPRAENFRISGNILKNWGTGATHGGINVINSKYGIVSQNIHDGNRRSVVLTDCDSVFYDTDLQHDSTSIYEVYSGITGNVREFTAGDATPSVRGHIHNVFKTANAAPTTVTNLDDGYAGQKITVIVGDANTTFDFTGTNLKGNGGADWVASSGDHLTAVFDGTDWYCTISDNT